MQAVAPCLPKSDKLLAKVRMKEIRWGTLGCGDVCERKSGPPLYETEGSRLVAVMRRDLAKARDFAARHGVPRAYGTVGELVGDPGVNAVYVASPHACHRDHTLAAARAGKHVLCEKDMALNVAECDEMIAACAEAGVTLGVAFYRRCYPVVLRAKALVDSGGWGAIRRMEINDEFPLSHRLDLFHFFLGDVAQVRAVEEDLPAGSHARRGKRVHLRARSGAEAVANHGWKEVLAPEVIRIECERGVITVADLKKGVLETEQDGHFEREDFGPERWTHSGLVQNFVDYLNGGAPLACNGVEGRKSQLIQDIADDLPAGGEWRGVVY